MQFSFHSSSSSASASMENCSFFIQLHSSGWVSLGSVVLVTGYFYFRAFEDYLYCDERNFGNEISFWKGEELARDAFTCLRATIGSAKNSSGHVFPSHHLPISSDSLTLSRLCLPHTQASPEQARQCISHQIFSNGGVLKQIVLLKPYSQGYWNT